MQHASGSAEPEPEPDPELDARFSAPDAEPTDWATTKGRLETAQLAWITTVRRDGRPHMTPLVMVWLDGAAYFCTGPEEQKSVNLDANDSVALAAGCTTWNEGIDVVVEGRAVRVTGLGELERLAAAWQTKWDGSWMFSVNSEGFSHPEGGLAHVYRVEPTKLLAFDQGVGSHTRYRF